MTELEMQRNILIKLKGNLTKTKIKSEVPYSSGCSDVVFVHKSNTYAIEIKKQIGNRVLQQLENQNIYYKYLIAVTHKPQKTETITKWDEIAKSKYINLVFFEDLMKTSINKVMKKMVANPEYDQLFSLKMQGELCQ